MGTRIAKGLIRSLRALRERTAAELKQSWRALQRVTVIPSRNGESAPPRSGPQRNLEVITIEKTS
ncbi:hypothetical protein AB0J63_50040, partial [Streptosporangium canum]|uniref:hypothetical protein n=1 Tax=Streptosporangium canum TaxID=324952 RepID=UPI003484C6D1